jgi:hypothetical protein
MAVPAKPRTTAAVRTYFKLMGVLLSWDAHGIIKNL